MQLTIRIPDEYSLSIEKLTEKMGLKKSDIARLALKQFLDENSIESKIEDLGQRHRDYLIQKIKKN